MRRARGVERAARGGLEEHGVQRASRSSRLGAANVRRLDERASESWQMLSVCVFFLRWRVALSRCVRAVCGSESVCRILQMQRRSVGNGEAGPACVRSQKQTRAQKKLCQASEDG